MNQKPIDPDSLYPELYCIIDNCLCQKITNKNKIEPDIQKTRCAQSSKNFRDLVFKSGHISHKCHKR